MIRLALITTIEWLAASVAVICLDLAFEGAGWGLIIAAALAFAAAFIVRGIAMVELAMRAAARFGICADEPEGAANEP